VFASRVGPCAVAYTCSKVTVRSALNS
jgi:hypothetical protein